MSQSFGSRRIRVILPKVIKTEKHFSFQGLLFFGLIFAVIGGYFLYRSFAAAPVVATLESEQMGALPVGASLINDSSASAGKAVLLTNNSAVMGSVNFPSTVSSISVIARAGLCQGAPTLNVALDGTNILSVGATSTSWSTYSVTPSSNLSAGSHILNLSMADDYTRYKHRGACSRSLYLDVTVFYGPTAVTPPPTVSFSASPSAVTAGNSSTLTWNSANATSCSASGAWSGAKPLSGSASTGALNATASYSLTCTGDGGTATASASVTVQAANNASWPGNPYPPGSIWNPNQVIPSNVAVDLNSASIISYWLSHRGTTTTFDLTKWAIATAVVRGGEPTYNITGCSYTCSYNRFGNVPIPLNTLPDPAGDKHLAILDLQNGREWDLYQAAFNGSTWSASCGDALFFSERSVPSNICGAVDANFPAAAGIVQPEEIKAGVIKHPLVFATTTRGPGAYRCPATHEATSDPNSPIVNGMWFQLDPSVSVSSLALTSWEKIIAKAIQDYGMYLRDGSGTNDIYGENPINRDANAWTNVGLTPNQYGAVEFSSGFPWNKMRVLSAPC